MGSRKLEVEWDSRIYEVRRKMKIFKCLLLMLAALLACQDEVKGQDLFTNQIQKRSDGGVDFLGMRVSYPQYLRLVAIQKEVIRMDQTIRHMLSMYDEMNWHKIHIGWNF